jgi:3-deoxy-7-phosphoheptulonate synthase
LPSPPYTSHEALVLDYEEALLRRRDDGRCFASSAHAVWVGERTRGLDEAHVEFLAGIANPIGVKLGPGIDPDEVTALCELLNPGRIPGRLSLITRLGATRVEEVLPALVRAVTDAAHPVVWLCDPMHGNTYTATSGYKTRRIEDIVAEVRASFAVHRDQGTYAGGLHLEAAADDVTECVGGGCGLEESDLPRSFRTACDPRLNPAQVLECVLVAVGELMSSPGSATSRIRL